MIEKRNKIGIVQRIINDKACINRHGNIAKNGVDRMAMPTETRGLFKKMDITMPLQKKS